MANELTLLWETHIPIPMTVADGTGIERGAPLKLTDPMTAIATSAIDDECAGVLAEEKIASDGNVEIPVYRGGIFKATASGSILINAPVTVSNLNTFETAATNSENVWGISLEAASDTHTFALELRPTVMQLA